MTLLLNNDAYPLGDAFAPLLAAFVRPEVAIAGGALFFEDGATQAAGLDLLGNAHWHYSCRNLPPDLSAVTAARDALAVSGAAMAVRTNWFVESGGFDEGYRNGFEDVDLCMRARTEGRAIAYVAAARFAHYEGATEGRFAREAENEARFYARWSAALHDLPRTARGDVGAISVRTGKGDPLLAAQLADLETALRSFGHPVVRGAIAPWRRFDRRFARSASLSWFGAAPVAPGVDLRRDGTGLARMHAQGAAAFDVPWLPCAAAERIEALAIRRSADPACDRVGVAGSPDDLRAVERELGRPIVAVTPDLLVGNAPPVEIACVVHAGLTDDGAFGNVLLAQAGLPAVVASENLRSLFASDVALFAGAGELAAAVKRFTRDPAERTRYGDLVAADARRRFSPRRSAIRVVDVLCASRFGLERAGERISDTPL